MNQLAVTLVIEPPPVDFVGIYQPTRKASACDEFASALGKALGFDVPILESTIATADAPGLVLLWAGESFTDYLKSPEGIEARSRIFLMEASRTYVLSTLDRFGLAGAIETYRYFRWRTDRSHEFGGQVFGKRDVVMKAGVQIEEAFSSERYALFDAPNAVDLPSALAWYLRQYWESC